MYSKQGWANGPSLFKRLTYLLTHPPVIGGDDVADRVV